MLDKKHIGIWLLVWGMLDLLCALFCEIHADEAYYRLYGQFLDWGYFDHPPMVGLMTAISATLIPATSLMLKNLSVRLVTVLMHVATVYIVWRTVDKGNVNTFLTHRREYADVLRVWFFDDARCPFAVLCGALLLCL